MPSGPDERRWPTCARRGKPRETVLPRAEQIKSEAIDPYFAEEITQQEAIDRAVSPVKRFMLSQAREKDIALFLELSGKEMPETAEELPLSVVVPGFPVLPGPHQRVLQHGQLVRMVARLVEQMLHQAVGDQLTADTDRSFDRRPQLVSGQLRDQVLALVDRLREAEEARAVAHCGESQ